jgi:hypothetical protein
MQCPSPGQSEVPLHTNGEPLSRRSSPRASVSSTPASSMQSRRPQVRRRDTHGPPILAPLSPLLLLLCNCPCSLSRRQSCRHLSTRVWSSRESAEVRTEVPARRSPDGDPKMPNKVGFGHFPRLLLLLLLRCRRRRACSPSAKREPPPPPRPTRASRFARRCHARSRLERSCLAGHARSNSSSAPDGLVSPFFSFHFFFLF